MDATWIVSANAGRARFFSQTEATDPLVEMEDMVNAGVRMRTVDTESDSLGQRAASKSRNNVGAATQPNGYEPNQLPAEHQTEIFARSVSEFLIHAHHEGRFRQLCLVASPEFLGVLRKMVEPKLNSAIRLEINKDYTQFNANELRERLKAHTQKH